jgi:hypothetical protein
MMHVTSAIVETKDKETEKPNDLAFLLLFPSFFDFTDTGNPQTSFSLSRARKHVFGGIWRPLPSRESQP